MLTDAREHRLSSAMKGRWHVFRFSQSTLLPTLSPVSITVEGALPRDLHVRRVLRNAHRRDLEIERAELLRRTSRRFVLDALCPGTSGTVHCVGEGRSALFQARSVVTPTYCAGLTSLCHTPICSRSQTLVATEWQTHADQGDSDSISDGNQIKPPNPPELHY